MVTYLMEGLVREFPEWKLSRAYALLTSLGIQRAGLYEYLLISVLLSTVTDNSCRFFIFWLISDRSIICQTNWRPLAKGYITDRVKPEEPHKKLAVATWNLGTISAIAQRQETTKRT
jgi:hypothetical protein